MENVEIIRIDKTKALAILEHNDSNRRVTRANVDFIKSEMLNGNFSLNGSTIVISANGKLLDGQHRLIALSEADLEYNLIVMTGAKEEVFKTIDTGKNRNPSDILSIEGVKNANNVSSTIRKVIEQFSTKRKSRGHGTIKLSNTEVLNYYTENKEVIEETVDFCHKLYNNYIKVTSVSNASAFLILFSKQDKQKAKSFIRELFNGIRETDSNASITLRQRLINSKIDGNRMSDGLLRSLFIIAFRAYSENRNLAKIQVSKDIKNYLFKQ